MSNKYSKYAINGKTAWCRNTEVIRLMFGSLVQFIPFRQLMDTKNRTQEEITVCHNFRRKQ